MKKYCTKCGSEMVKCKLPQNLFLDNPPEIPSCYWSSTYPKYCQKTGKRTFFNGYKCPKIWFIGLTNHDIKVT
jgi:hypothetical protein